MEIVYYVAASLDGCIATPDGGIDWLKPFEASGEDYGYAEFYASVDCVLLGRRTYEQSLRFGEWPYPGKPCRVFSKTGGAAAESGVRFTRDGPGHNESLHLAGLKSYDNGIIQLRYLAIPLPRG